MLRAAALKQLPRRAFEIVVNSNEEPVVVFDLHLHVVGEALLVSVFLNIFFFVTCGDPKKP